MGAEYQSERITGNESELQKIHDSLVEDAQYEDGHGGYTGTFAESPGLTVTGKVFATYKEADDWLLDNAEKWENSLAVQIKSDTNDKWLIGGWFSS